MKNTATTTKNKTKKQRNTTKKHNKETQQRNKTKRQNKKETQNNMTYAMLVFSRRHGAHISAQRCPHEFS